MVELGSRYAQLSTLPRSLALRREPLLALAKPLGSGSNPVSAVVCSTKLSKIPASIVLSLAKFERMRPTLLRRAL